MVEIKFQKYQLPEIVRFCWVNFNGRWRTKSFSRSGSLCLKAMSAETLRAKIVNSDATLQSSQVAYALFEFDYPKDEMLFKLSWG